MARHGADIAVADDSNDTEFDADLRSALVDSPSEDESTEYLDIAISGESTAGSDQEIDSVGGAAAVAAGDASETPVAAPINAVLERLRQHGLDLPGETEEARADYLAAQLRQAQTVSGYAPYLDSYIRNAAAFSEWQRQQQQAPVVKSQPEQKWWNPPARDEAWQDWVVTNENGERTFNPDTPPEIRLKFAEHQSYIKNWANKLTTDPESALAPLFAQREAAILEKVEQRHAARQQENQVAQQLHGFVQQREWMFQRDQGGQLVLDQQGRPISTPEGARLQQWANYYSQNGVSNPVMASELAASQVENEVLRYEMARAFNSNQVTQGREQADLATLKNGAQRSSGRANSVRNGAGAAAPMQNESSTFEEMLRHEAQSQGVDLSKYTG